MQSGPEVEDRYGRIPPELEAILLPFQKEGVLFGLRRSGRLLIADEMGVGKTLQAIALMCCYTVRFPLPLPRACNRSMFAAPAATCPHVHLRNKVLALPRTAQPQPPPALPNRMPVDWQREPIPRKGPGERGQSAARKPQETGQRTG